MKLISSYAIEVKHIDKALRDTVRIYRDAVSFCIRTFEQEWPVLSQIPTTARRRFNYAERLIHSTEGSTAAYREFDHDFYKMPSYMRRDAVNAALGYLSSYHSNLGNWEKSGRSGKGPSFQPKQDLAPTFYRGNMYGGTVEGGTAMLKLFSGNDWVWIPVKLEHTDVTSIKKHMRGAKMSCPTIERKNRKWFLRFAFEELVELSSKPFQERRILAVDLGINTDAACSVMECDGTVLARKFINFASDKDRLYHALGLVKKSQHMYASAQNTKKLWRYAKSVNDSLAKKIACAITDTAIEYGCDVIVFEHLDMKGKTRGSKKQRLAMWKKNTIQDVATHKAHRAGIRISRICAWGTSRLAYDGSGRVLRGEEAGLPTCSLCRFRNGRIYNCDLSASYNIGARYFLREYEQTMPVTAWTGITAKVPECQKRTLCTYATLRKVNALV